MKRLYFEQAPIFYIFANILGKRQYFMILLDFALQIFVYIFVYRPHWVAESCAATSRQDGSLRGMDRGRGQNRGRGWFRGRVDGRGRGRGRGEKFGRGSGYAYY